MPSRAYSAVTRRFGRYWATDMRIELSPDACLVALITAGILSYAWRDYMNRQLDELQSQGVIAAVDYPRKRCHHTMPVAKNKQTITLMSECLRSSLC